MSSVATSFGFSGKKTWLALPFILIGPFLSLFDQSVVNLSATAINESLHLSVFEIQVVVGGYALTYGLGLVFGGELGDAYGRKRLFRIGLLMFGLTSLACGIAQDPMTMVVARLLQGMSAAILLPQVLAMIRVLFSHEERPRALSWFVTAIGAGMAFGQILGGLIPAWNIFGLSWRPLFLIAVPLCAVSWYVTGRLIDDDSIRGKHANIDVLSFLLLAGGYAMILLPVANIKETDFLYQGFTEVVLGITLLAGFKHRQGVLSRTGRQAIMPDFLFQNKIYVVGVLLNFMLYAAGIPFFFILGLYLLGALDYSSTIAGLSFSPIALGVIIGSRISPKLLNRFGFKTIIGSLILMAVGITGTLFITRNLDITVNLTILLEVVVLIFGLGNGIAMPIMTGIVLTELPPERAGIGASILTAAQQLGGVAGIAATGAVTLSTGPDFVPNYSNGFIMQVIFAFFAIIFALILSGQIRRLGKSA